MATPTPTPTPTPTHLSISVTKKVIPALALSPRTAYVRVRYASAHLPIRIQLYIPIYCPSDSNSTIPALALAPLTCMQCICYSVTKDSTSIYRASASTAHGVYTCVHYAPAHLPIVMRICTHLIYFLSSSPSSSSSSPSHHLHRHLIITMTMTMAMTTTTTTTTVHCIIHHHRRRIRVCIIYNYTYTYVWYISIHIYTYTRHHRSSST